MDVFLQEDNHHWPRKFKETEFSTENFLIMGLPLKNNATMIAIGYNLNLLPIFKYCIIDFN